MKNTTETNFVNAASIKGEMSVFIRLPRLESVVIVETARRIKTYWMKPAYGNDNPRVLLLNTYRVKGGNHRGFVLQSAMKDIVAQFPHGSFA